MFAPNGLRILRIGVVEHAQQIAVRGRIVGAQRKCGAQLRNRVFDAALLEHDRRQQVIERRVMRFGAQAGVTAFFGVVVARQHFQEGGKRVPRGGRVRVQRKCRAIVRDRAFKIAGSREDAAEVAVRFGRWRQLSGAAQLPDAVLRAALGEKRRCE